MIWERVEEIDELNFVVCHIDSFSDFNPSLVGYLRIGAYMDTEIHWKSKKNSIRNVGAG